MNVSTTRFGSVTIDEGDVLTFVDGLIGMEQCRRWVLLADAANAALGWLQSLERADVALAVAEGRADTGLGLAAMARRHGLDFVSLARERYDLVVWRRDYFEGALQRLFEFAHGPAFAARGATMDGYEFGGLGSVRYNGP